jgi:selenocysteine-specific elongation factor
VRDLEEEDRLVLVGPWAIDFAFWQREINKVRTNLREVHARHPLEIGMDLAQLQKSLGLSKDIFDHLIRTISETGEISIERHFVSIRTHKPTLSPEQKLLVSKIMEMFERQAENPPSKKELSNRIPGSEELVRFMCREQMLVEVEEDILFDSTQYQRIKNEIIDVLGQKGRISIQETRDLFGLSRKYILPLMKKLDKEGITAQEGSERVLAQMHQNNV